MRRSYALPLILTTILLFCWEVEFFIFEILPELQAQANAPPQVVINEVAWMGTKASPADEWIELYNASEQDVALEGWTLTTADGTPEIPLANTIPAQDFYLLERTDDQTISDIPADRTYTGALSNPGEHLFLKNQDDEAVDELDNTQGWFAGNNEDKTSMERVDPEVETNDPENWASNNQKIIKGEDAAGNPILGTPKGQNSASFPSIPDTQPQAPSLRINEFLPNPSGDDRKGEYVEIFNFSDSTQDLKGWKLKDESERNFTISITVGANAYGIFYTGSKFMLNNDGDTVYLTDQENNLVDAVSYIGKVPENQSYNYTKKGWQWSTTLTPGALNIITQEDEPDENGPVNPYPRHLWINEFLPDPEGKDVEGEFIEIFNPGPDEIDLEDWQLDDRADGGSRPYSFPQDSKINPGEYLVLSYAETKIALNNTTDWVRLLWPSGQAIDEIEYDDPPKGESYNKTNRAWCWSPKPTPGEQNVCSSETREDKKYPRSLWINEFLPDPVGRDVEGEFIEIQNRGQEEIDLSGWQLDDLEDGGSRPYTLPQETTILPDHYLVLYHPETKIALNNQGDWVRLLTPSGEAIDEVEYGKAPKGQSYARQNVDSWQWTLETSPGQDNEFPKVLATDSKKSLGQSPVLPQTGPKLEMYSLLSLFLLLVLKNKTLQ